MNDAETKMRIRLIGDAQKCGFWGANTNDKFVGGKPDMRLSRRDTGQMDFELKILGCEESTIVSGREVLSGITPLQHIELRDMNRAGAPAVGLVLLSGRSEFVFTNEKRFSPRKSIEDYGTVKYIPHPKNGISVDFVYLFRMAKAFLEKIGYAAS